MEQDFGLRHRGGSDDRVPPSVEPEMVAHRSAELPIERSRRVELALWHGLFTSIRKFPLILAMKMESKELAVGERTGSTQGVESS